MLALKVGDKFVPVSDALMAAILAHAAANVAYGRAKRADQGAASKAANQAERDLFDAIAVYVGAQTGAV